MSKKIIAALMALVLLFAFAACGTKTNGDTTTTEADTELTEEITSEDISVVTDATEASSEDVTEASSADATEASSADATEASAADTTKAADASESETESTTEAPKAPQTKAEIVAYFNNAVNGVKKDAKSATRNYSKIKLAGSMTLPSAINGVLKLLGGADEFVGGQLEKNSKGSETFTGSGIKDTYPVEGETYASKLTEADVKSATCTEKDGKYTITIVTVADGKSDSIKHGQGHAPKAFNVVLPGVVNDNIPGVASGIVGTATMNYPSSTAKIVVDAKTGKVLTANYDLYWTINFDKAGVIIPFVTSDSWTIKY